MTKIAIILLSIIIPLLIVVLFFTVETELEVSWVHYLPVVHAIVNGATAVILVLAVYSVKHGNVSFHKQLMKLAFGLGVLFVLSYVVYHVSVPSTKFGDLNGDGELQPNEIHEIGNSRIVYLGILLSHILTAIIALPLILTTYVYALKGMIEKHKKIVRFTFPVWLYVSVTGVLVYLLISPYY